MYARNRGESMVNLLIKLFIKDSTNFTDKDVRQKYGVLGGFVGIVCNILLCIVKFIAGIISSSIAITADAFNNLSDAGSSIITLIGFKMAGKPADNDHPFGHGRMEYLSGLLVSIIIILMGLELVSSSIKKIIHPSEVAYTVMSVIILLISIGVKFWMAYFNRKVGAIIDSEVMKVTAIDSLSDCIATAAVLLGALVSFVFKINIDGYMGILVAVFVLKAGIGAAKDTIWPLLGQPPKEEFVKNVEDTILNHKEIVGIHDMVVHDYGPGRVMISLHAEIPQEMNIVRAHDIIDYAEEEVKQKFMCDICIHMDPIVTQNENVKKLKEDVQRIVREIDESLSIHDFRITQGPLRTNLIFDLVIPFSCKLDEIIIKEKVANELKMIDETYFAVIKIDRSFL